MPRPIALITGASAGIGAEYARQLSASGHDLVLVARREERLRALAADLPTDCEILAADLEQDEGVGAVAKRISDGSPLALVINNAGFAARGPVASLDPARLEAMLKLNIIALSRLSHAAMRRMADEGGAIINVASGTVFMQMPGNAGYGASKCYVASFTRHMQVEAAGSGVSIQLLIPGVVATEFHEVAGTDIERFPPQLVMQAPDVVHASLAALAMNEPICMPSLADPALLDRWIDAEIALAATASRSRPAERYTGSAGRSREANSG